MARSKIHCRMTKFKKINFVMFASRCELPPGLLDSAFKYKRGDLEVEVFEIRSETTKTSSINFTVPIDKRTTGYIK